MRLLRARHPASQMPSTWIYHVEPETAESALQAELVATRSSSKRLRSITRANRVGEALSGPLAEGTELETAT